MTLRLSETLVEEIRRQGELAYPGECCGVLAGRMSDTREIHQLVSMPNRRTARCSAARCRIQWASSFWAIPNSQADPGLPTSRNR